MGYDPGRGTILFKLRYLSRFYRQLSKQKAQEFGKEERDVRAKLELAIVALHGGSYDCDKQGDVSELNGSLDGIEIRKARGVAIRSSVNWDKVGDKCLAEFLKFDRQKNFATIILELKHSGGNTFTQREDLDSICDNFYKNPQSQGQFGIHPSKKF